jgi:hypothetical protein
MTTNQLKKSIGEISEHLKIITDLRKRAYDGNIYANGAYGNFAEIGLDTTLIYKSALILEEQLTYQLSIANQTYKLMTQVDEINEEKGL